jgi:glutamate formiminotransferase
MLPVLEAVPNFSEGRDPDFLDEVVRVAARAGAEVVDASMDPDHNRSVVTYLGRPSVVEAASLAVARVAMDRIDLREHRGTHPRVGALDVLPFVPLVGCGMETAVACALRTGAALAGMGLPVTFYGHASTPPGVVLADVRRGGFEALRDGFPPGREPSLRAGRSGPHPTAGMVCVGAREVLLAWNVWVWGVEMPALRELAGRIRERGGGFPGLRALAMELPEQGGYQISMNLENVGSRDPMEIFEAIESGVEAAGGEIQGTEVIGMVPETLVLAASARRLKLLHLSADRILPVRVARHLAARGLDDLRQIVSWLEAAGDAVPDHILEAVRRLSADAGITPTPGETA